MIHMQEEDTDDESDSDDDPEVTDNSDHHDIELTRDGRSVPSEVSDWVRDKWREIPLEQREPFRIHLKTVVRMGAFLLACKKIREEAQPIFAASVHSKVVSEQYEVRDLPNAARQLYLLRVQEITLISFDEMVLRHEHGFDVRRMPNLNTLQVREAPTTHTKYIFDLRS